MIPKYYEFANQAKIISGYRALENIPYELGSMGARRPMLLTAKENLKEGILGILLAAFHGSELVIGIVRERKEHAAHFSVDILNDFEESKCDSLLAVGDGSVVQTAKELSFAIMQKAKTELCLLDSSTKNYGQPLPFIAVPTRTNCRNIIKETLTADHFINIISHGNLKRQVQPHAVVLDPRLILNLSPRLTAAVAFDVLCHAIEAYTSSQKNPLSDAYALSAIKLVAENLAKVMKDGRDRKARLALSNAAVLSEGAFANAMVGLTHAIAFGLESCIHIPHEEAIGILLPNCMDYCLISNDAYYGELLLPLAGPDIYADTPSHERGRKTVQTIRNLLLEYHGKVGLPICLSETGIKRADFNRIRDHALKEGSIWFSPAEIQEEDILNVLNLSF